MASAGAVALLVGVGGTAYAAHYRDLALPGSSVAGVSVAGKTKDEVAANVRERAGKIKVTVTTRSGSRSASLADIGYAVDVPATVAAVFDANSRWTSYPKALVSSRSIKAKVTVDQKVLDKFVAGLVASDGKAAVNAKVAWGEGASSFTVTPATTGLTVDPASLQQVVAKGAETLTSPTATVRFIESQAAVSTTAAQGLADKANALVALPVTVNAGSKTFTATPADKASWITFPVSAEGKAATAPSLDKAKLTGWVDAQAAAVKVDVRNGVRNVSSSGAVLKVTTSAQDGSEVTNAAAISTALASALGSAKAYTGTFDVKTTPATWTERRVAAGAENLAYPATDGEKWVDVNLSAHTMTAYEGARAVIGPVAMVNGAPATPTVQGTFHIYSKTPLMTMRGSNADGTNYEAPDVPWVAFFTGGYALHGAYWRSSFGYAASHGCVNLPVSVAKQVYDWAPVGTPVVTHG